MDNILDHISDMPEPNLRKISKAVNVSRNTLWRVLQDEEMHTYHVQRVQGLELADYHAPVDFTMLFL